MSEHYTILEVRVLNTIKKGTDSNIPLIDLLKESSNLYQDDYKVYKSKEKALLYTTRCLELYITNYKKGE